MFKHTQLSGELTLDGGSMKIVSKHIKNAFAVQRDMTTDRCYIKFWAPPSKKSLFLKKKHKDDIIGKVALISNEQSASMDLVSARSGTRSLWKATESWIVMIPSMILSSLSVFSYASEQKKSSFKCTRCFYYSMNSMNSGRDESVVPETLFLFHWGFPVQCYLQEERLTRLDQMNIWHSLRCER